MEKHQQKHKNVDMTDGTIWKQLLLYAIPILLGDLFQQLYNTVDSIIVGNCLGKEALAAVGATNTVINILIGLFTGISTGATVVISQYFGARAKERLQDAVHTTIALTLLMGAAFTCIGVLCTPMMLRLLDTPPDVYLQAKQYLQIYFAGIGGLVLYNMSAGILRAVGDSRRPLLILVFSSALNIGLDLLFIVQFGMGVDGAALATILSQFLSAGILLLLLCRSDDIYRLSFRSLRIHPAILRRIMDIGLPVGLQKSLIAMSNTIVISYVNKFGSGAMAGWSVYHRLDSLIQRGMQSMSVATTTFVGQNIGAKKEKRIRAGVPVALKMSIGVTLVGAIILVALRKQFILLFNSDSDVLYYGATIILAIVPFQAINCVAQIRAGELRGRGMSKLPMVVMTLCYIALRQAYLAIGWQFNRSLLFVLGCYPISWLVCAVALSIFAKKQQEKAGTSDASEAEGLVTGDKT